MGLPYPLRNNLKAVVLFLSLFVLVNTCNAQFFQLSGRQKRTSIPFKFIKNLIIIPVSINDQGPFNFILDTGVGLLLITDYKLADSLQLKILRDIKLVGLGENSEIEASISPPLNLTIGNAQGNYIPAAILKKDIFNLSEYVGMPIHGLLGYEFFNSFITRISYNNKTVTIFPNQTGYIPRKGQKIPITIEERKPYIETPIILSTGETVKVKLIIDTGAGHPVSLETNSGLPFPIPEANIAGNLGVGLAGPIRGYLGRIKSLNIGKYELKDIITAFPNYNDVGAKVSITGRNGNLGNQILKHFETVFDYSRKLMYVKPSFLFKEKFEYDMSGMELSTPEPDFKRLFVSRVAPGSAADLEGIEAGDEILSINLKPVANFASSEIDDLFKSGNERSFFLEIQPKNSTKTRKVIFTLKRRI